MERMKRIRAIAQPLCAILMMLSVLLVKEHGAVWLPVLLIAIIGTAALDSWLNRRIRKMQEEWQNSLPILTERATVLSRRVAHTYSPRSKGRVSNRDDWRMTFQTQRSDKMEMIVPHDVYMTVTEGQQGMLKHQGRKFYSFTKV